MPASGTAVFISALKLKLSIPCKPEKSNKSSWYPSPSPCWFGQPYNGSAMRFIKEDWCGALVPKKAVGILSVNSAKPGFKFGMACWISDGAWVWFRVKLEFGVVCGIKNAWEFGAAIFLLVVVTCGEWWATESAEGVMECTWTLIVDSDTSFATCWLAVMKLEEGTTSGDGTWVGLAGIDWMPLMGGTSEVGIVVDCGARAWGAGLVGLSWCDCDFSAQRDAR